MNFNRVFPVAVFAFLTFNGISFAAKPVSIENFKIHNQIANWVEEAKSYKSFNPEQLFEIIDGGATEYIDNGMQKGIFQQLKGPDLATTEVFAEDFGNAENARKMLTAKRTSPSDSQTNKNADTASFFINKVVGGFWACGTFEQYYFELTLMGIKDEPKALSEIHTYFDYYRKLAIMAAPKK